MPFGFVIITILFLLAIVILIKNISLKNTNTIALRTANIYSVAYLILTGNATRMEASSMLQLASV